MSKEIILQDCHKAKVLNWDKVFVQNPTIIESAYEAMDIHAKNTAIEFFKWYVLKMTGFLEYLSKVKPIVTSIEIEENLKAFEGKSFNELYELFLQSKTLTPTSIAEEQKEWEILKYIVGNGVQCFPEWYKGQEIYSVLRKSDNQVFSVGDRLSGFGKENIIDGFIVGGLPNSGHNLNTLWISTDLKHGY